MQVEEAFLRTIENWRARLLSVGVPSTSLDLVVSRLEGRTDWPHLWRELGDAECEYAREQESLGRSVTASDAWSRAGLYYHFGQFVLFDDDALRAALVESKLNAYARAFPGMRPPADKATIETEAGTVYAVVRRPSAAGPAPAVIVLPGADSSKEEYASFEDLLLERGMATVTVDGPGQGETRHRGVGWRFDYEEAFPKVTEAIRSWEGIDGRAIGLMGFSFGGYLAPRVAARCQDISATVSHGGCYDLSGWESLPPLLKDDLAYLFGAQNLEEAKSMADEHVSLRDIMGRIEGDLLIVHSTEDRIFSDENARRMKDGKPEADIVVFEGGDHCCHNLAHRAKPLIADWLAERLGQRA